MSNPIPPMISSSPPPIDVQDDDEDDGVGDFRVANLSLYSDFSVGRCSPDSLSNLPSPNEDKVTLPISPLCSPINVANGVIPENDNDIVKVNGEPIEDNSEDNVTLFINGDLELPHIVNNCSDIKHQEEPKPPDGNAIYDSKLDDDVDDEDEIANIPFSPTFTPSVSPPPKEETRTSPEGADSISECVDISQFELRNQGEGCDPDLNSSKNENNVIISNELNDDGDDDFADFASQTYSAPEIPKPSVPSAENIEPLGKADDFDDDFDDFESAAPPFTPTSPSDSSVGSRVAAVFANFQSEQETEDSSLTSCLNACLDDSSSVWGNLKDLETSNALGLQWTSSIASKKLLSSLNIDSRNVLLGPRWNSSVPRFAANLGCAPLEPKQADSSVTPPPPPLGRVPSIVDDVVPVAQFDWNSSGLTNPLDCVDKDEATSAAVPSILETPVSSRSTAKAESENVPQQSVDPSPDFVWNSLTLPDTDILLPRPAEPSLESSVFRALSLGDNGSTNDDETSDKLNVGVNHCEEALDEQKDEKIENTPTWTISNQLTVDSVAITRQSLSPEAYRVVETLPDLSFLSARNLLLAANQNMTRFNAGSRL